MGPQTWFCLARRHTLWCLMPMTSPFKTLARGMSNNGIVQDWLILHSGLGFGLV